VTAMFPDSGVPPGDARNSLPDPNTIACNELWYSTSRCQPRFDPAAANAMLAELVNLINKGEVQYNCNYLDQIEHSVRYLIQRGLPRSGYMYDGPNYYTMTLDPSITRYNDYMTLTVVPLQNNAGVVLLNVGGLGYMPVLRNDKQQLKQNDLQANVPLQIAFYNGAWYVTGLVPSQATFPTEVRFEAAGNYVWTVPVGVYMFNVELYGGGGGGGSGQADKVGGGGGGAGGYARKVITTTPGTVYSLTVGAGGNGGASSAGGYGGTSSFGGIVSATGGNGGNQGVDPYPGVPSDSGVGVGGDVNLKGGYGSSGSSEAPPYYTGYGGLGGASPGPEGGAGGTMSTGSAGPGLSPGSGGSGGGAGAGGNAPGGGGHTGSVFIKYIG
jgi:hypothetical protein